MMVVTLNRLPVAARREIVEIKPITRALAGSNSAVGKKMCAEIVNLNKARKQRVRKQARQQADENAVKFGLSRAEKDAAAKRSERETRLLDGNKRDPEKPT